MTFLRNLWRRGFVHQYFAGMDPADRATALIALVLTAAIAVSFSVIVRHREPSLSSAPWLTAPALELRGSAS
jgi:hypothetical protein